jgi:hypothetical protein
MRIFQKLRKTEAQHTIEYVVLMILVMAGVIISGPYVIRSWNANLEGWGDSVVDSIQEPILPDPEDIIILPGCSPRAWNDLGCGGSIFDRCAGSDFGCGDRFMLQKQNYEPPGCQCVLDPPLPSPPSSGYYLYCNQNDTNHCCDPWMPDPPTIADCGPNAEPPCPDWYYRATRECDIDTEETTCLYDPICQLICTSPPYVGTPPHYDGMCTNDDMHLHDNIMNTLVEYGECTDARKCETQCGIGMFPFGSGVTAYCGPCPNPGIQRDGCSGTLVNSRGCGMMHFKPCCIGECRLGGVVVPEGSSYRFWRYDTLRGGSCSTGFVCPHPLGTCDSNSQLRTCVDGALTGNPIYQYASCECEDIKDSSSSSTGYNHSQINCVTRFYHNGHDLQSSRRDSCDGNVDNRYGTSSNNFSECP